MDKIIEKSEIRRQRRKQYLRVGAVVAATGLALWGLTAFMGGKSVDGAGLGSGTAEYGPLETSVAASGRIVPAYEEIIISPVSSRILEVYARSGDTVSAGAPLLRLDLNETEAQCQNLRDAYQIKANSLRQLQLANRTALSDLEMQGKIKQMEVNRLKIEVENERRLDSLGSGTGDRVRQAETALATGLLELEGLSSRLANERQRLKALEEATALEVGNSARDLAMMERTLEQGRIPAPRDGVLTFLNTSIGSTVGTGDRVAVLGDLTSFKVEADVPEGSSYKVKPGANAIVRMGNVELAGTVSNIEPQSTSGAVPFSVTLADASNARLRPGVRVQVYVGYGYKEHVLRLPFGSFYEGPGTYSLFVYDGDNRLVRRSVGLGDSNRQWVEVTDGLQPGDRVVISDMKSFENYKTLKIKN